MTLVIFNSGPSDLRVAGPCLPWFATAAYLEDSHVHRLATSQLLVGFSVEALLTASAFFQFSYVRLAPSMKSTSTFLHPHLSDACKLTLHDPVAANAILSMSIAAEAPRGQIATSFLPSVLFEAVICLRPQGISFYYHGFCVPFGSRAAS